MQTKLVLYLLALLTGLAAGPGTQASAASSAQPVEQCAAPAASDRAGWFAELPDAQPIRKPAAKAASEPRAEKAEAKADCTTPTPVSRKDLQRE